MSGPTESRPAELFDADFRRRLERLTVAARRMRPGQQLGERRSPRRGTTQDFADFRPYTPGDDLRRVDWNIYARLERALIKLYHAEEELTLHLLIDTSASMAWGQPDKLSYARRTAAALGYLALTGSDRVLVTLLDGERHRSSPLWHGRVGFNRLLTFLAGGEGGGTTDLERSLTGFAASRRAPGPLFLISDLLAPAGWTAGLVALIGARYDPAVIHLLAPDEVRPDLSGSLRLVDRETGHQREVTVDPALLAAYAQRLSTWQAELQAECHRRGIAYLPVTTDQPFEELILTTLRGAGLITR